MDLQNVQQIFLTTDGFHDQFGGDGCRKLMASRMKELFVEFSSLDAAEQEFELRNYYQEWKGREPQTDDVLVIGIRNPSRNRRRQRPHQIT